MKKFDSLDTFVSYYEREAQERGGRNDWQDSLAKIRGAIPYEDETLFYEDYYVRVVLSTSSKAMLIERKENHNPVLYRDENGKIYRSHGEWALCQPKDI